MKKACKFLLSRQMADGGWGEDFTVSHTISHSNKLTCTWYVQIVQSNCSIRGEYISYPPPRRGKVNCPIKKYFFYDFLSLELCVVGSGRRLK